MPETKEVYENEWKQDIEFPKLINYENLTYTPESLSEINSKEGQKLNTAINDQGQVITDLINSTLNTQTKQILGDFTFGTFGAIKMITDNNNGIWISPTGILGKKGGATTFAIDSLGNATFAGTLVAASGTFGTITSGNLTGVTITGGLIRTASAGQRVELSSSNYIGVFNSNGANVGRIFGDGSGQANFWIEAEYGNNLILNTNSTYYATLFQIAGSTIAYISVGGLTMISNKILNASDGYLRVPVGANRYQ